jgi:hypothetical protein
MFQMLPLAVDHVTGLSIEIFTSVTILSLQLMVAMVAHVVLPRSALAVVGYLILVPRQEL